MTDYDSNQEKRTDTETVGSSAYIILQIIAGVASCYHLYTAIFGMPMALFHRTTHITFMLVLIFFMYDIRGKKKTYKLDAQTIILSLLAIAVYIFIVVNLDEFLQRFSYVEPVSNTELLAGIVIVLLILEATRRAVGPQLPVIAIVFILYALFGNYLPKGILWHRGVSLQKVIEVLYMNLDGMWSEPINATSTYVFLFTIFASFLITTGVGEFFSDFALASTKHLKGGAAKTACISSALMGTICGASTANVVATGSFTIPLMKKSGFSATYAGAVEAVSSTGGQILPPVMGVAAFIMVEITGIPYAEIVKRALFPAILYFVTIYFMIHFHACKENIQGSDVKTEKLKVLLLRRGLFFTPLIVILLMLVRGFTPQRASIFGIIATVLVTGIRKETRPGIRKLMDALIEGAKMVAPIAVACACAGIVMGMVLITGLGFKMMQIVIAVSGGRLLPALLFTMIAAIILGMGLPTSAAYIIMATMLAPAIVNMGVPVIIAHLFVFYFACISSITPPVALASYAAAGLSGADPIKTSFAGMRLGITAFIVPFAFVYQPAILLIGTPFEIVVAVITALCAVYFCAATFEGWIITHLSIPLRFVTAISAAMLFYNGLLVNTIGMLIFISVISLNYLYYKKGLSVSYDKTE